MRSIFIFIALALLVAVGVYLIGGRASTERGSENVNLTDGRAASADSTSGSADIANPQPESERTASSAASAPERPSAAAREGRTIVVGRIVDEEGAGIEGVDVQLGAKRRWSEVGEVQPFASFAGSSPTTYVGFSELTDMGGWFVIDAPVPGGARAKLFASKSPLLSTHSVDFAKGARSEPPLEEGLRDLGTIELKACGRLCGTVFTDAGTPLEGARVIAIGAQRTDRGRERGPSTESGPDGTFALDHVPAGQWILDLKASDWVEERSEVFEVEPGRSLDGLVFRMTRAPIVKGRVLAPDGSPIEGAALEARGRLGARAVSSTDAQGAFALALPRLDEFDLTANHTAYEPLQRGERTVDGNTVGEVRITLIPRVPGTLRVVDEETDAALARFGVAIVRGGGSKAGAPEYVRREVPKPEAHPSGTVEVLGSPGSDLLIVTADGYRTAHVDYGGRTWPSATTPPAPSSGDVSEDMPLTQTIRMSRGAAVHGSAVSAGQPPQRGRAHLARLPGPAGGFGYIKERQVSVDTDSVSGQFRFDQLDPGRYELTLQAGDGNAVVLTDLLLEENQSLDLGVIELLLPGKIEGSVRASEGMNLNDLEISVVDVPGVAASRVDEGGRFVLENVPAGTRTIQQTGISMDIYLGTPEDIDVPSGGVAEVVMDVTSTALVAIEVDVELDGLPLAGAELRLVRQATWPKRVLYDETESHEIYLGNTDQDGHTQGRGRLLGPMVPVLHMNGWNVLHHPTRRLDLRDMKPLRTTIRFESATAVVQLPESAVIPENGSIDFEIASVRDPRIRSAVTVSMFEGRVIEARSVDYDSRTTPGSWKIPRLSAGDVTVKATIYDVAVSPRSWRGDRQPPTSDPVATYAGTLTLRAGKETKVELE